MVKKGNIIPVESFFLRFYRGIEKSFNLMGTFARNFERKFLRNNLGFWQTATYPSPKPTLTLSSHLRKNVGLGEG